MTEPVDFTINANMHSAFKREIARLQRAVETADLHDPFVTGGIQRRYRFFSETLHTHHEAEDTYLWPAAMSQATPAEQVVLTAMEAEHEALAAALAELDAAMSTLGPDTDIPGLDQSFDRLHRVLVGHCAHEERDAIPVIQQYIGRDDLKGFMQVTRSQQDSDLVLPWICDGATAEQVRTTWSMLPAFVRAFVKPMTTRKYNTFTQECGV